MNSLRWTVIVSSMRSFLFPGTNWNNFLSTSSPTSDTDSSPTYYNNISIDEPCWQKLCLSSMCLLCGRKGMVGWLEGRIGWERTAPAQTNCSIALSTWVGKYQHIVLMRSLLLSFVFFSFCCCGRIFSIVMRCGDALSRSTLSISSCTQTTHKYSSRTKGQLVLGDIQQTSIPWWGWICCEGEKSVNTLFYAFKCEKFNNNIYNK